MNKSLKQAVYKKKMLFNKFQKHKTSKNWENLESRETSVNQPTSILLKDYVTNGLSHPYHLEELAFFLGASHRGGGRGFCWSTVYRCVNNGQQNLP